MNQKRYIIGIDLGTTNSSVSYVDLADEEVKKPQIRIFRVPQLTAPGEISRLSMLPSFLYLSGAYDIDPESLTLPWATEKNKIVGSFARDHGSKVPARLVSSAKSWLCHGKVDRYARILPWGHATDLKKISPIEATAEYLNHIRMAWNDRMQDDEELYLENQMVIITVPASFDEVARDLTVEAAKMAGMLNITLLEEPLAAFYSWLNRHENEWNRFVKPGDLILICDVGGGTTDFTLITLSHADGNPRFDRIAVGDHLILGGDNIDLTLARNVEMNFNKKDNNQLNIERWQALCYQCRQAKEEILSGDKASKIITIVGEGSRLIGGTLSSKLDIKEIEATVLEGFFPIAEPDQLENNKYSASKKGITEFGLPYEKDPAITRHLCAFLEKHRDDIKKYHDRDNPGPDLILFNGGSLKPNIIQSRIKNSISHWFNYNNDQSLEVLSNPDPFLAVAIGASYYGLVKIGHGVRVGSGSARSYYLGVDTKKGNNALCIIERGLEEGSVLELKDKKFEVLANRPVSFDLFSSSYRSGDNFGDLLKLDDSFTYLPPLKTIIQFGKKSVESSVPVNLEINYTEMGTLELWCISQKSNHRWQLRFELRQRDNLNDVLNNEVFEESIIEDVKKCIREVLLSTSPESPEQLVKLISDKVQRQKENWPLSFLRSISDELLKLQSAKKISPVYESRWFNLIGYSLRPGFGEALDEHRINKLWKIYKPGPVFNKNPQVISEWWILWRRVAGGLSSGQQRQFIQDVTPSLKGRKGASRKITGQERIECWMAVGNMERLSIQDKYDLGKTLLNEIKPKKCKPQQFWALSRIGARDLLYGPMDRVLSPDKVSGWIEKILHESWRNPKPVVIALIQLARLTGDRKRDMDEKILNKIIDWASNLNVNGINLRPLKEIVSISNNEKTAIFGESLPQGIIMHNK